MNKVNSQNYTKAKKLKCDCSEKKNYLIHYWMLKVYVRHGMIVDKYHEIILVKRSRWLEKYTNLIHRKELGLKMTLKKTSITY